MMIKNTVILGLGCLSVLSNLVFADDAQEVSELEAPKSEWNLLLGTVSVDSDIAEEQGIDDNGYYLGAAFTGYHSYLRYSLGAAIIFVEDNDEFSQRVEDFFGDESTEDSTIETYSLFAEIGSQYAFGENDKTTMGLMLGYSYFNADRTISNCRNCESENIDIDSSFYLKPFIAHQFMDNFILRLEYVDYFEDQSFENAVLFNLAYRM